MMNRQVWRDRMLPVGMRCEVHDGTKATVPGVIEQNTGVLVKVRLDGGRVVARYDHEVFGLPAEAAS